MSNSTNNLRWAGVRAAPEVGSDEELMGAVRAGEIQDMAALFERHHGPLLNFFYRMTGARDVSEDLVQDVFFRMLKYRDSYQPPSSFRAWMYRIARNAHTDRLHKSRGVVNWNEEHGELPSREAGADERLTQSQEVELLRKALNALPVEKRELLILSRFQNLKYEEIGQILGCEVGAVKVRVFRAVKALGQIYTELTGGKTR